MWRPVRIAANLSREWLLRHSKKTIYRQLFHSRSQANYATAYKPDLIQANDLYTLATAAEVAEKTGAVLAYDAYECFDGYFSDRKTQELVTKIEQTFLRKVRLITSPEKWGCDDLFERYGTTAQRVTLLNGVSMIPDKITPCEVHQPIRLLSQASLRPGGNEELLIKAMVHLRGKALLTIQGGGDKNTEKRLHQLALDLQVNDIVSFTGRFAPDKAVQIAIDHDIGVNPIGPNNPNHDHGRGHRFFVFLAAGLALGTAPLASIRNWPEFDKFGFLIDTTDPKRCAASLEKVIAQPEVIFKKKQHALHCAPHYYWENAVKDYIAAIDALLTKPV
jgi:glycosyltransferase involved in cell wall biosynthesis